jgi:hypothetical protein
MAVPDTVLGATLGLAVGYEVDVYEEPGEDERGEEEWGDVVPTEVAARAPAAGSVPKPVLRARPKATKGFLIRDLQDFWSH